jgi:putative chitinase
MLTESIITSVCRERMKRSPNPHERPSGHTKTEAEIRADYVRAFTSPEAREIFSSFGISASPAIMADFMANVCHESGGMMLVRENPNYTAKNLMKVWGWCYGIGKKQRDKKTVNRDADGDGLSDMAEAHGGNPVLVMSYNYNGRMGNRPGTTDGYDFRGGGPLQCTGREMYLWLEKQTGLPFASDPKTINDPDHWARIAALTFCKRTANLCSYAEAGNFTAVCKAINTGSPTSDITVVGMAERMEWRRAWLKALGAAKPVAAGPIVYKFGMPKSDPVKAIQVRLNALMYGEGKLNEDGDFGRRTRSAVVDFQMENGVEPHDGAVGPKTWAALFDAKAKRWPAPAVAVAGVAALKSSGDPEVKKAISDNAAGWTLGGIGTLQLANISGLLDGMTGAAKQASEAQSSLTTIVEVLKFAGNNLLPILCILSAALLCRRYSAVVYERVERWTRPVGGKPAAGAEEVAA